MSQFRPGPSIVAVPNWKIQSEFDPRLGFQTLSIGCSPDISRSTVGEQELPLRKPSSPQVAELAIRSLANKVIDAIEQRYSEKAPLLAGQIWPNAAELVRQATWDSPDDAPIALFFHPSVDPVEVYLDAVCRRAGVVQFGGWSDSTWQSMTESFKILVSRPMRIFHGVEFAAIRKAKHEGYAILQVRP